MLSREWGNVVRLRFSCLIPGIGRFYLTQRRVLENGLMWESEERYMKFPLISACGFHPRSHVRKSWTYSASSPPWLTKIKNKAFCVFSYWFLAQSARQKNRETNSDGLDPTPQGKSLSYWQSLSVILKFYIPHENVLECKPVWISLLWSYETQSCS